MKLNGAEFDQFISAYLGGLLKNKEASVAPEILRGTQIHYIALAHDAANAATPDLPDRIVYFAAPRTPAEKLTNVEWARLGNAVRSSQLKPPICFDLDDVVFRSYVIVVGSLTTEDEDFLKSVPGRKVRFLTHPEAADADDRLKVLIDDANPTSDL